MSIIKANLSPFFGILLVPLDPVETKHKVRPVVTIGSLTASFQTLQIQLGASFCQVVLGKVYNYKSAYDYQCKEMSLSTKISWNTIVSQISVLKSPG